MVKTEPARPATLIQSGPVRGSAKYLSVSLTILFGLAAVIFPILAVIGTVRSYSPVPSGDMWGGYLGFYLKIHAGDWGAWWAPWNEHRIVLSRLVFWIDIVCFHGNGVFSLVVIYVAALLVGVIFAQMWRERFRGRDLYVLFFLEAWIFSWSQRQNFTWAFQSQFILAQMLPLAGLYFLHLSATRPEKSKLYFAFATLCGVLAVGSMANGVLALPALAFYAAVIRMSFRRTGFLVAFSMCELYLYFHNITDINIHGGATVLTGEASRPIWGFVQFFLRYLGSPFILLFSGARFTPQAILVGELSATLLILASIWAFFRNLGTADRATLPFALLVFIFFIVATSCITAAGRFNLGLDAALGGRYLTPALYGWAAGLLLFWPAVSKRIYLRTACSVLLTILLCFFMFPQQLQALANQRNVVFQNELAALALELQINDVNQVLVVAGPFQLGAAPLVAKEARAQQLSVFGFPPIKDAHLLFGHQAIIGPVSQCRGNWDAVAMIPGAPQYVRVRGWLFNSRRNRAPQMVYLVNATNEIVGLGFIGEPRGDVVHAEGQRAAYSGFEAYLSSTANGQRVSVWSPADGCELPPVAVRF
jgi:hypothetical protein